MYFHDNIDVTNIHLSGWQLVGKIWRTLSWAACLYYDLDLYFLSFCLDSKYVSFRFIDKIISWLRFIVTIIRIWPYISIIYCRFWREWKSSSKSWSWYIRVFYCVCYLSPNTSFTWYHLYELSYCSNHIYYILTYQGQFWRCWHA